MAGRLTHTLPFSFLCIFIFANQIPRSCSGDTMFLPSTNVVSAVVFAFGDQSNPQQADLMHTYFNFLVEALTTCTNCIPAVTNFPTQLFLGKENATFYLQEAESHNVTAAFFLLGHIPEFQDIALNASVNSDPTANCPDSLLCQTTTNFVTSISDIRGPLTRVNMFVLSDECVEEGSFGPLTGSVSKTITAYIFKIYSDSDCTGAYATYSPNATTENSNKFLSNLIEFPLDLSDNTFNMFVILKSELLDEVTKFIVEKLDSSDYCKRNQSIMNGYNVQMLIKYSNKNVFTKLIIPWVNWDDVEHFTDFVDYSVSYALTPGTVYYQEMNASDVLKNMGNSLNEIYRSNYEMKQPQFNVILTDEFPDWLPVNSFTAVLRYFDVILLADTEKLPADKANWWRQQFFLNWQAGLGTKKDHDLMGINFFVLNSTEYADTVSLTTCLNEVNPVFFDKQHIPNKWWRYLLIGLGAAALFLLFLIIFYCKCVRNKNEIEKLVNQFNLTSDEAKIMAAAKDQMFLDPPRLVLDYNHILGRGSSSTVYAALLKGEAPLLRQIKTLETACYHDCTVAVKVSNQFGRDQIDQLIAEVEAAKRIGFHTNICVMLGWSMHLGSPCLLFEPMNEDLLGFVRSLRAYESELEELKRANDKTAPLEDITDPECLSQKSNRSLKSRHSAQSRFSAEDEQRLTGVSEQPIPEKLFRQILWQTASALEFVASKKIVHRDVAARNILLTKNYSAKLADFGLCCDCDEETSLYKASFSKRLPIKWLSLEALLDRTFSEKSDVWAFGVMMFEMYSRGATPYPGIGANELSDFLKDGNRLEKVADMGDEMYELALSCWREDLHDRPTFADIKNKLTGLLEDSTEHYGYIGLESIIDEVDEDLCYMEDDCEAAGSDTTKLTTDERL